MLLTHLKHLSVLYAEDDEFSRLLYAQMLQPLFSDLRLAADGQQALELYAQRPCDLLLTDLQMPGVDGMQLCRELRTMAPDLPIIIISGHGEGDLLLQTANLGIDGYLLKPVVPELLEKVVLKAVDRLVARQQIEQSARVWSQTFDAIPDLIAILDEQYRVVTMNRAAQERLQVTLEDVRGRDYCAMLHPGGQLSELCLQRRKTGDCCVKAGAEPVAMLDGYFNVTVTPICDEQGRQNGTVHVARNMTEKAYADLSLIRSEARYRMLLNSGYDAIFVHGIEEGIRPGLFTEVNDAACRMFGYSREELLTMHPCDLNTPESTCNVDRFIDRLLEDERMLMELEVQRKDGSTFPAELSCHLFFLDGRHQVLSILRDCTERKRQEAALRYVSTHDQLTDLYNRSWFESEFARLASGRSWPISFVMVDLNDLKQTNDRLGHAAGDELLSRTAGVLRQSCRADEMIARVGGDEFVIMLPGIDCAGAELIIERIRKQVQAQQGIAPQLSLSLGTATAESTEQMGDALSLADQRMYQNKAERKRRMMCSRQACGAQGEGADV